MKLKPESTFCFPHINKLSIRTRRIVQMPFNKGAFLIEAKQLFFCEVNFVYMFTNGTIFLHANEW